MVGPPQVALLCAAMHCIVSYACMQTAAVTRETPLSTRLSTSDAVLVVGCSLPGFSCLVLQARGHKRAANVQCLPKLIAWTG